MRSFLRQEHGNALVELAVAIPILILIAVGVADYSRLYFTEITVANAARSGADWGIKAKVTSTPWRLAPGWKRVATASA
jgi:Flp pilus assembly protein TadG